MLPANMLESCMPYKYFLQCISEMYAHLQLRQGIASLSIIKA